MSVTMVCLAFADTGIENRAVARREGETGEWSTTGRHLRADQVAAAPIEVMKKRKKLVLPWVTAKTACWTWRASPALYELMRRSNS